MKSASWSEETWRRVSHSVAEWLKTGVLTCSVRKLEVSEGKEVILTVYRNNNSLSVLKELLPSSRISSKTDGLLLYPEEQDNEKLEELNWCHHWESVAHRLNISFGRVGEDRPLHFVPLRIHPHIIPYLGWLVSADSIVTVTDGCLQSDFMPLETVLRFHSSNIDYDSQVLNLISAQIAELCGQLHTISIFPRLELSSFLSDDSLWLLFDPIAAIFHRKSTLDLEECTQQWVARKMSNFDYLVVLNQAAGRRRGEVHNHPIFPWVCDFSEKRGGWRPLKRTKFRLNKGDDQLREMFTRIPSHHVPELLSDIGYMVYRARVESKDLLCRHVRSKWVPREYPASVARIYEWTPDECIPEFYDDASIFRSIHPDMPSLELPPFINTPEEFVKWHRDILESEEVSQNLHNWIDLTFGYLLSGEDAVRSLNVHLALVERFTHRLRRVGVVQLFEKAHPQRESSEEPVEERLLRKSPPLTKSTELTGSAVQVEDEDSLVSVYRQLRTIAVSKGESSAAKQHHSALLLLAQIALAPVTFGRLDRDNLERNIRQFGYVLSPSLRQLLASHMNNPSSLPVPSAFPLYLLRELNVPFSIVSRHDELAVFHALHILRRSVVVTNDSREQSLLAREGDALRRFVAACSEMQFVVVPLVRRLLEDPVAAVNTAHRLMAVLARSVDEQSLSGLVPVLVDLISSESSSIKLLDRRFLLPLSVIYGAPKFFDVFLPPLVEAVVSKKFDRSVVAKESILWLGKRYGPVVCARYLSANLLRILGTCYDGMTLTGHQEMPTSVFSLSLEGDSQSCRALEALAEVAATYSVTFITVQYIPFCVDLVEQWHRRATPALENGLLSILRVLLISCNAMTDHLLMNYLQEYVVDKILNRIITSCLSSSASFSCDRNRLIIFCRAISALHEISIRVGAEVARTHIKEPFANLFDAFAALFYADDQLQIKERVQPKDSDYFPVPLWLATAAIDRFVLDWGVPLLTALCPDPAFLVPFVTNLAPMVGSPRGSPFSTPIPSLQPQFHLSSSAGNRLYSPSASGPSPTTIGGLAPCDSGTLSSLWCTRVAAAAQPSQGRNSHRFDHLTLCSFEGHIGNIRCVAALSNENSYISGSSDRTVKLWSMKCESETVEPQWTYTMHSRSVVSVVAAADGSIASADGSVHVWDPFRGSALWQLDWSDGVVSQLAAVDRSTVAAISNLHSYVRLFDLRGGSWTSDLRVSSSAGLTRAVSVNQSNHRIAVALSNGSVLVMDSRTGKVCSISHGNSSHPTSLHWLSDTEFVVCDADDPAAIYSVNPRISVSRRLPEAVGAASFDGQLLTTLQGSCLRMYAEGEQVLESKLKGDPTSILRLPLNNAFLVGFQNGSLHLMC